jgi:D-beta-D-heptose 7-phosphate kinase/D-beta-D-heptose 1-phosphate adenosyltransferase
MRDAHPLTRSRAAEIAARFGTLRVAVVGDLMLDRYLVGDIERISPEAPVPVVLVTERRDALGGAANVAANVVAAGASCRLVGVVGSDIAGTALRDALTAAGIDGARVLSVADRPTTTKTRVVARGQQVCRVDEEVEDDLTGSTLAQVSRLALAALEDAEVLLLEDYDKGTLAPTMIPVLVDKARSLGIPVVVDPKYRHFYSYAGATVFKPNRRELESALGVAVDPAGADPYRSAYRRANAEHLLVTLGAGGMALVGKDETVRVPGNQRAVFDVSGAGDTVTAWVGLALAAGATMEEAAVMANVAAGIEVGKPGVATVSVEELLAAYDAG